MASCSADWSMTRDWLAYDGLTALTSLRLVGVQPSNGLSALINLQARWQSLLGIFRHLNAHIVTCPLQACSVSARAGWSARLDVSCGVAMYVQWLAKYASIVRSRM